MKDERSASQIQFGFLPEQTVDAKGGVWKVAYWNDPPKEHAVDIKALRHELLRAVAPWTDAQRDSGFAGHLRASLPVELRRLNRDRGVTLKPFPAIWMCRRSGCRRLHRQKQGKCKCGATGGRAQLPFVGYHECGRIREPAVPYCKVHNQVSIHYPGTASARDIRFYCPECNVTLRHGLSNNIPCECGDGSMRYNVHRAASVYTPRSIVMVNPPTTHRIEQLTAAGGPARAVEWVLDGMQERSASEVGATSESLRQQLKASGLPDALIEQTVRQAVEAGALRGAPTALDIDQVQKEAAERDAVLMAMAAAESRITIGDLQSSVDALSEAGVRYHDYYPRALRDSGMESVELFDKFPVMVGHYGFTRGPTGPGESSLRPFRDRDGTYFVYGEVAETEAMLFRLSPLRVWRWLRDVGMVDDPEPGTARDARLLLLRSCQVPSWTTEGNDAGRALLQLVHSLSHRAIRIMAVHAGIERNALAELLVTPHLSFYIYAAAKGDFVLGGLQAVFESDLDTFLRAMVFDEHRCALDPGCERGGGACTACLHIGEPSCRFFNQHLSRATLFGPAGYLR
ncbi:hypothetical protein GCM10008101_27770 [Lysobacter xinjiangensis]|uniref:Uncharacterized protein n=1 Tax=Cognatilysobacter xinjiangensis TaxID=546892 RepID=A0ABQ3C8A2_9GAMM|nr:hypothetical protein [Lysobacter xinjiangensis]GGZ71982.1 hypothetical protein GCM10008101_27770 [Lysobacter xinjiangensis]